MRINKFLDTSNIWLPFPNNYYEKAFTSFFHSGDQNPSISRDYDE